MPRYVEAELRAYGTVRFGAGGQKRRIDWVKMLAIAERWLPRARILPPLP